MRLTCGLNYTPFQCTFNRPFHKHIKHNENKTNGKSQMLFLYLKEEITYKNTSLLQIFSKHEIADRMVSDVT